MHYHFGYSDQEIDKAVEGIKKTKKQRQLTKAISPSAERTQESWQNVTRRIKRTFSREKIYYQYKSECHQFGGNNNGLLTAN